VEGYLTTLMLPDSARPVMIAMRALNVEVARVRDAVNDLTIGRMRMRFWKDAVESAFKGVAVGNNPVILALTHELKSKRLNKSFVMRMIQERVCANSMTNCIAATQAYTHTHQQQQKKEYKYGKQ
jgi:NADH dehydrogenase [ubiquinone] 1 alpha subcomplex assembly factor 6